jgi:hypothetical protein
VISWTSGSLASERSESRSEAEWVRGESEGRVREVLMR